MAQMIAYCGIDCRKCPAYRLPRLGEKLHMKGLFQWLLKRGMREKPEGYVICDGCTTIDARCLKPCLDCPVRCCAMERGVVHCGRCERFGCERLQQVWKRMVFRDAEPRLRRLHAREGGRGPGG